MAVDIIRMAGMYRTFYSESIVVFIYLLFIYLFIYSLCECVASYILNSH